MKERIIGSIAAIMIAAAPESFGQYVVSPQGREAVPTLQSMHAAKSSIEQLVKKCGVSSKGVAEYRFPPEYSSQIEGAFVPEIQGGTSFETFRVLPQLIWANYNSNEIAVQFTQGPDTPPFVVLYSRTGVASSLGLHPHLASHMFIQTAKQLETSVVKNCQKY